MRVYYCHYIHNLTGAAEGFTGNRDTIGLRWAILPWAALRATPRMSLTKSI